MKLRSALGVVGTTLVVATAGYAAAASLGSLGSEPLGSGSATVTACDTDGVTTAYSLSGSNVISVTVSGIADSGCEGANLSLTLTDSSGSNIGAASSQLVPTDGDTSDNSMVVAVTPQPLASEVTDVHIAIVGP